MTKNNEIAKKETKNELMFGVDESALKKMSEDAATHVDDTNPDDIAMPRLRILQSASDQVKKSTPEYIKGAEEGDLFNTLSKEVFKAESGLFFVPAKRRVVYLEWKDQASGGGLVNNFGEDASAFLSAEVGENGKRLSKDGHEIVKTYDFFGYVINLETNSACEVVISMSKTSAKKAKQWYAQIRNLSDKETGKQLPEYAGVYKLTTTPESNDKGSWFNYNVDFAGYTLGIPNIGKIVYEKAKEFSRLIAENSDSTKVVYENEAGSAASDDGRV